MADGKVFKLRVSTMQLSAQKNLPNPNGQPGAVVRVCQKTRPNCQKCTIEVRYNKVTGTPGYHMWIVFTCIGKDSDGNEFKVASVFSDHPPRFNPVDVMLHGTEAEKNTMWHDPHGLFGENKATEETLGSAMDRKTITDRAPPKLVRTYTNPAACKRARHGLEDFVRKWNKKHYNYQPVMGGINSNTFVTQALKSLGIGLPKTDWWVITPGSEVKPSGL
jgi:hypothetical protein